MLHIYSYSTCVDSTQTVVLIQVQCAGIWGTPLVEIYYSTMRLQVVIQLLFFDRIGKISPFREVLKKSSSIGLIECLGKNKSLSNTDIKTCMTFIQTVLYGENINEAYVETRTNIYYKKKTKSSMTLPLDLDSATQVILRVHYQCCYWVRCF